MKRLLLGLLLLVSSPAYADGIDQYVVFGSHFDGTDGGTSATDFSTAQAAKTITFVGNAQLDTAQFKFGTASLLCDGAGDYVSMADSADWDFGTGNFTWDGWFRFSSVSGNQRLICQFQDASNEVEFVKYADDNTMKFIVTSGGSQILNLSGSFSPSTNTWYHIAIIRGWNGNADDWAITVDGTAVATTTSSITMPNYSGLFLIGSSTEGTATLNGWSDEPRISKGIARWTANFTPPTEAYSGGSKNLAILGVG